MKTTKQIAEQIMRLSDVGKEFKINESLHFGMSIYAYKEDIIESGLPYVYSENSVFAYFNGNHIESFLNFLLERDGYLSLN